MYLRVFFYITINHNLVKFSWSRRKELHSAEGI